MNYPVWDLAMGGSLLIAIISIIHVFISHFAVGGGLWLVVTEMRANRSGDRALRDYVRGHTRFFILLTLVLGALTGVGIWFTIGLVSPDSVSALIHVFLWGWAMEWVFFLVEIAAAMVYYYGWEKLDPRRHVTVGWIYFIAAWMSLLLINGIITFMLTPGQWLQTRSFWDGFFNPTFWPSLVLRTGAAIGLAGLLTMVTAVRLPAGDLRTRIVRHNSIWVLAGIVTAGAAAFWYKAAFPGWLESSQGAIPILPIMLAILRWSAAAVLVLALWPLARPGSFRAFGIPLLLAAGLIAFGAGEWIREAGRKPFTIRDYMYSTGLRVEQEPKLAADGVLAHTRWRDPAASRLQSGSGRDMFRAHCRVCHTWDGHNGLGPFLSHWNRETVASLLPRLQHLRAKMPPWYGTDSENEQLTGFLLAEGGGKKAWPENAVEAERLAWDLSCGLCHTVDRFRPLREAVAGLDREELDELLEMTGELMEEMPAYHGDERQRTFLLDFLQRIAGGAESPQEAAVPTEQDHLLASGRRLP